MKSRSLALFVAAAVTTVGVDLNAQNKARQATPAVKISDARISKAAIKMDFIEIADGSLRDALAELKEYLKQNRLQPLNIIYSQGADGFPVPELSLRNVTGPDALRLICTAADCQMEPIFSEPTSPDSHVAESIIGYRISPQQLPTRRYGRGSSGLFGGTAPTSSARSATVRPGLSSPFAPSTSPPRAGSPSKSSSPAGVPAPTAARSAKTASGGTQLFSYGGTKPAMSTRVYALSRITTRVKFPDVEKTMLAMLAVAGHKPTDASLALHENTNVLVVRASEEVHELVANLLESLAKNSDDAETGEVANLQRKMNAFILEADNLKRVMEMRVQEAEKRRRDAEDQLNEVTKRLRQLELAQKIKR